MSPPGSDLDSQEISHKSCDEDKSSSSGVPEFDSISSSLNEKIMCMLDKVRPSTDSSWSSVPGVEEVIIDLVDQEKVYQNPFQLTEDIRRELASRVDNAAERALNWSLSSYDEVGGRNTLRSVWSKLKSSHRVRGSKRSVSSDDNSLCDLSKKFREEKECEDANGRMYNQNENENHHTLTSSGGANLLSKLSIQCQAETEVFRSDQASTDDEVAIDRSTSSLPTTCRARHGRRSIAGIDAGKVFFHSLSPQSSHGRPSIADPSLGKISAGMSLGGPSIAKIMFNGFSPIRIEEQEVLEDVLSDEPLSLTCSECNSLPSVSVGSY